MSQVVSLLERYLEEITSFVSTALPRDGGPVEALPGVPHEVPHKPQRGREPPKEVDALLLLPRPLAEEPGRRPLEAVEQPEGAPVRAVDLRPRRVPHVRPLAALQPPLPRPVGVPAKRLDVAGRAATVAEPPDRRLVFQPLEFRPLEPVRDHVPRVPQLPLERRQQPVLDALPPPLEGL